MAETHTREEVLRDLEDRYGRLVAANFKEAIDSVKDQADLQRAVDAIDAGDFDALMEALHVDEAVYNAMLDNLDEAYADAGHAAMTALPPMTDGAGDRMVFRFNIRNPRAEAQLRDRSSTLVTRLTDDQRTVVRQALQAGLERGDNPTTTALNLVGRIDKSTGARIGGLIGLTSQQAEFVETARDELASGDAKQLANYLNRSLRDRGFDAAVAKALDDGAAVPADVAEKAIVSYENRLLKLRGDTIARTETLNALRGGQHEAYQQAIDKGLNAKTVTRTWRSAGDDEVRETHQALNGQKVFGMQVPFTSPSGAKMLYPGDTSYGAGAEEIINCRCLAEYGVDFLAALEPQPQAGVTFEVAPDPNNEAATAAWNKLPDEQKLAISQQVAEKLAPIALKAAGTDGQLVFHMGGYQGATNPSMTLQLADPAKAEEVAKLLGYALSQDSMMVISPVATASTARMGVIDVEIGDADPAAIYDRLYREVTVDGEPIVTGHTTINGRMAILNDSGLSDEEFATRISAALGNEYDITLRDAYVGFIGKDDYGFGPAATADQGRAGETAAEGSSLRAAADRLRAEADAQLEALLAPPREPLPADEFTATEWYDRYANPQTTVDDILARFPPDVAQRIEATMEQLKVTPETIAQYRNPDGTYTVERMGLHQDILFDGLRAPLWDDKTNTVQETVRPAVFSQAAVENAAPKDGERPVVTILGGRGGSGKGSLRGVAYDPSTSIVLDSDAFKGSLPEYRGWNAAAVHEESSDLYDQAVSFAMDHKLNVVLDATLKSPDKAVKIAEEFRAAGYEVRLAYAFAPPQLSAYRAVDRFTQSGRFVSPAYTLASTTNEQSFEAVRQIADEWSFYDMQGDKPLLVSSGGRGQ